MARIYVGLSSGQRSVFKFDATPSAESHAEFNAVIGPFRTMRAARLMSACGNNPHIRCVADAERVARKEV